MLSVLGLLVLSLSLSEAFLIVPPIAARPSSAMLTSLAARKESFSDLSSRGDLFRTDAGMASLAILAGATIFSQGPKSALADSTGKYSTKQTAKIRYLPRIKKGVARFEELGKQLTKASPDVVKPSTEGFAKYVEDDLKTAMALYGSSTRMGELPDDRSRTLERDVEAFVSAVKKLPKAGSAVMPVYDEASQALNSFLEGVKLPPIGSADYKQ